jgi:hypothetical protein
MFARTCQECGHVQEDKRPEFGKKIPLAYQDRKCKKCKSSALDFGHDSFHETAEGKVERD